MSQRLLTVRVRPARVVVLLNHTATSDQFVLVVRFLSQIWGGKFAPILPVSSGEVDELTRERLGRNRPDFVFAFDVNDAIWEPAVHKACQPRQYIHLDAALAADLRHEERLNLIHSDRAVIAGFEHKTRPSSISRPVKVLDLNPSSDWLPYFAAQFGLQPADLAEKYRDEHQKVDSPTARDFIRIHQDFVDGWKDSWLDAGCFGLRVRYERFPRIDPTIVVVKNLITDLCLFWNLRLAADTDAPAWVIPLPEACLQDATVRESLREWMSSFKKYGRDTNYCLVTSGSVDKPTLESLAAAIRSSMVGSGVEYVDYESPKRHISTVVPFDHSTIWPVEIYGKTLQIIPPAPKALSVLDSETWFVDLLRDNQTGRAPEELQLPESPVMPDILNAPCPSAFQDARVPRFGDGCDSINFHCSVTTNIVHLGIPSEAEILEEILRDQGYDVKTDEKRNWYLPVLGRFGGLAKAARDLTGETGKILHVLCSGRTELPRRENSGKQDECEAPFSPSRHVFTVADIKSRGRLGGAPNALPRWGDELLDSVPDKSDRWRRIAKWRLQQHREQELLEGCFPEAILEHWADREIVPRKWKLGPCKVCKKPSFVDGFSLRKIPKCQHCGRNLQLHSRTEIAYTIAPSVRHALSEGFSTVMLAGNFLRNQTKRGFFWLPGVKYAKNGIEGDIDILACCDGGLVFGECKRLSNTPHDAKAWKRTVEQFIEVATVASECDAKRVFLAAMVEDFPADVRECIQSKLSGGIELLLLGRAELETGRICNENQRQAASGGPLAAAKPPEAIAGNQSGTRMVKFGGAMYTKGASQVSAAEGT